MVTSGALRHDQQQAGVADRLDQLLLQLRAYGRAVDGYRHSVQAHQALREERRAQFKAQDESNSSSGSGSGSSPSETGVVARVRSWWAGTSSAEAGLTPGQRAMLAASRREERLDEVLGPAPSPPTAPRGVYLYGSVGSGKSLLMDMFFAAVEAEAAVPLRRRIHFNAAMLEVNSRIWALEKERMVQDSASMEVYLELLRLRAAPAAAFLKGRSVASVTAPSPIPFQGTSLARMHTSAPRPAQPTGDPFATNSMAGAAAAGGEAGEQQQQQQSFWRAMLAADPVAQKQKDAKLAKMATRRMIMQKLRRTPDQHSKALAKANAMVLTRAARGLIRGAAPLAADLSFGGKAEDSPEAGGRIAALLCFDELQISDVFTAIALKGVLEELVAEGAVVVATSNRPPWELQDHGLHEDLFAHFLGSLQAAAEPLQLGGATDYRRLMAGTQVMEGANTREGCSYFHPAGPQADAALELAWLAQPEGPPPAAAISAPVTNGHHPGSLTGSLTGPGAVTLPVMFGRSITATQVRGGAARFGFLELCDRALGAADYMALSQAFHTLFLTDVPRMSLASRHQARRFITLVDELYNNRVRLVCTAQAPPDELFAGAENEEALFDMESLQFETAVEDGTLRRDVMARGGVAPVGAGSGGSRRLQAHLGGAEERFAFQRAVSRLFEMQTPLYASRRPRGSLQAAANLTPP